MMKLRKTDYLQRLSRCARWMLPQAEAEEILEDYREIINQNPRPEQELYQDLGSPSQVVRQIAQPGSYRCWMALFVLASVCLLVPAATFLPFTIWLWHLFQFDFYGVGDSQNPLSVFFGFTRPLNQFSIVLLGAALALAVRWFWLRVGKKRPFPWRMLPVLILVLVGITVVWWFVWSFLPTSVVLLTAGLALTLVWFRRQKGMQEPFPWRVLPILILLLAGIAWVWWLAKSTLSPVEFARIWEIEEITQWENGVKVNFHIKPVFHILPLLGVAAAVLGMVGLVKARMRSRRWRAVYALSLTLAVLCVYLFAFIYYMGLGLDVDYLVYYDAYYLDEMLAVYWRMSALLTALGLVGTGASLC